MSRTKLLVMISCVLSAAAVLAALGPSGAAEEAAAPRERDAPTASSARRADSRPRRSGPWRARRAPLSPEQTEGALAFARQHLPELHRRLVRALEENPRRAQPLLRHLWHQYQRVRELPPDVAEAATVIYRTNIELFRTRRDILQAESPEEKERLVKRLRELVTRRFDSDLIVKDYRIRRLERELADLKAELQKRRQQREQIIEQRVKRWLTAGPGPGPHDRGGDRDRPPHP